MKSLQIFVTVITVALATLAFSEETPPTDREVIEGKRPLPGLKLELLISGDKHPLGEAISIYNPANGSRENLKIFAASRF